MLLWVAAPVIFSSVAIGNSPRIFVDVIPKNTGGTLGDRRRFSPARM